MGICGKGEPKISPELKTENLISGMETDVYFCPWDPREYFHEREVHTYVKSFLFSCTFSIDTREHFHVHL